MNDVKSQFLVMVLLAWKCGGIDTSTALQLTRIATEAELQACCDMTVLSVIGMVDEIEARALEIRASKGAFYSAPNP